MAKHFDLAIADVAFSFARKAAEIAAEAANDGLYVVRTSLPAEVLDDAAVARNTITTAITPDYPFTVVIGPTPIQQKAFDLLGVGSSQ